jgi:ubiquinone/menaquinone biosynthesis C-methylase UbiE
VVREIDRLFAGSVPGLYDEYLVPLIFEPYAADITKRLSTLPLSRILEVACGTGVVTRAMLSGLPRSVQIVATDFNQAMLDYAAGRDEKRDVQWQKADAMALPFPDESFDAVICQFGVMFFPDKAKAFSEARRVLKRGGTFVFNTWDRIEENEFADTVTRSLEKIFPENPPRFLARTPHGYYDIASIRRDLEKAGFENRITIETIAFESRADSPRIPAIAYVEGTPLRNEIEALDARLIDEATKVATSAVAERYGTGGVTGKIQAHVIVAIRD